ncbi:MAG: hypothetical protein A4E25_00051 [Methanobacterium sp. PtaB.Bin024]|nr:MAG: hypothetical protein A4E25_00051 [Methanobacterium sp. PtaB.Bin024]
MEKQEKIKLIKEFKNRIDKQGKEDVKYESTAWLHGLQESVLVLETVLGLEPDEWDDS